MRKKIIAGNWKMNNDATQAAELIGQLLPLIADAKSDVVVCPPYTALCAVADAIRGTDISLGAQNLNAADKGAFTGDVSADMLLPLGVKYVIIGHSERRQYNNETDQSVNAKTITALKKGLIPIVCVGESLEQRKSGVTQELIRMQTKLALLNVSACDAVKVVIAYEPIWAIGTGETATVEQANEACAQIRKCVAELYGEQVAQSVRIQYGGSMNAANAAELLAQSDIDGGLIGGASLKAADFATIVNCCK